MRKLLALGVLFSISVPMMGVFAAENTELIDELQKINNTSLQSNDLEFQTFASCDDMSQTLTDFVKENFDQWQGGRMPYRGGIMFDDKMSVREQSADSLA
jgi:hypothetical protein